MGVLCFVFVSGCFSLIVFLSWVGLQCAIEVFPDHTHLLFYFEYGISLTKDADMIGALRVKMVLFMTLSGSLIALVKICHYIK